MPYPAFVEVDVVDGRSNGWREIGVLPDVMGIWSGEAVGGFIDDAVCIAIGCIPGVNPGGICCGVVTCIVADVQ